MELPATSTRVPDHTRQHVNERIHREMEERVRDLAARADQIEDRLRELDREWDIERTLETNAASLALAGVLLGAFLDRRLLVLPALVTGFLLQHALQGWCPPVPVFRRMGFRTQREIDTERTALKALRGDFRSVGDAGGASSKANAAVRASEAQ